MLNRIDGCSVPLQLLPNTRLAGGSLTDCFTPPARPARVALSSFLKHGLDEQEGDGLGTCSDDDDITAQRSMQIPTAYATAMMKSRRVSSELYLTNLFSSTGVTLLAW